MSAQKSTGTVVALRIRTPELVASGPPRDVLIEIANAAMPTERYELVSPPAVKDTFVLPAAFELNAFDRNVIQDLANAIFTAADEGDALVVDLMMDQSTLRFGAVEQIFYSAVEHFAEVWPKGCALIVLMTRVPDSDDDIAQVLSLEQMRDAVMFVDPSGRRLGHDPDYDERVTEAVTPTSAEVVARAADTALRRRGVFRVKTSPRQEFAAYKYSVEDVELAAVLEGYIEEGSFQVIILDSIAAHWLREAGAGAAVGRTVALFHSSDHDAQGDTPEDKHLYQSLVDSVQESTHKICVVVPMIKNGERVNELLSNLRDLGRDDVQVLTVFLSDLPADAEKSTAVSGWATSVAVAQLDAPIHYLFDASLIRLQSTAWPVQMARLFHEDTDDTNPDWEFSRVGLWQMLDEHEALSGYDSGDNGVLMRMNLDRWDAGWLAASLVRKARKELERNPDEMLMVMPDEATAIRAVGDELKRQQSAAVLRVPRSVINNPSAVPAEVATELRRYGKGSIVVVDESTATYATVAGLQQVVFTAVQRHPDLTIVALDLPETPTTPPAESKFVSLYGWRPSKRELSA